MWRVRGVGFWALFIAVQASLSSYVIVATSWGMLRSQSTLHMVMLIFPALQAAMNLALVEERATVGWNFVLYAMVPPSKRMQTPVKDQRVLTQVAQSELE